MPPMRHGTMIRIQILGPGEAAVSIRMDTS
jgi:hypothetical protein